MICDRKKIQVRTFHRAVDSTDRKILEIGCGDGRISMHLAEPCVEGEFQQVFHLFNKEKLILFLYERIYKSLSFFHASLWARPMTNHGRPMAVILEKP